jgi:hypothetical protein
MTGGGPGLRTLLILSAIDLLSSALTAGVVLFVILVGADAGQSGDDSQKGKVGFNFVEVTDRAGTLALDKGVALPPTRVKPNGLEVQFFDGAPEIVHRQYIVPADVKKLLIRPSGAALNLELFVQPVVGPSFRLFFECANSASALEVSLRPTLIFPNCEKGAAANNRRINLPQGSKLILPATTRLNGLPPPEFESINFIRYKLPAVFALSGVDMWGVIE